MDRDINNLINQPRVVGGYGQGSHGRGYESLIAQAV